MYEGQAKQFGPKGDSSGQVLRVVHDRGDFSGDFRHESRIVLGTATPPPLSIERGSVSVTQIDSIPGR